MAGESDPLLGSSSGGDGGDGGDHRGRTPLRAFLASFWTMGVVAFGGPAAHIALMHDKFVAGPPAPPAPRVHDATFIELFALCSALPGPGSTQLATSLGATFGGLPGAAATFFIWQAPGSLLMTAAGLWFHWHAGAGGVDVAVLSAYFTGLVSAAFAMVCIAAFKIVSRTCGNSKLKTAVCMTTASVAVLVPPEAASWVFVLMLIASGGLILAVHLLGDRDAQTAVAGGNEGNDSGGEEWDSQISPAAGITLLALFVVITFALFFYHPVSLAGRILRTFWKVGATGFGGGTVVIPLILTECAAILPVQTFLFGFGLISLAPGPMFNMAWFLGAALDGVRGALFAAFGLFGPGILLLLGVLPFWERVRRWGKFRIFLSGVNAGATGLIVSGVWMLLLKSLVGPFAFAIAVWAASLSLIYGAPTALIIVGSGIVGAIGTALGLTGEN